jgi:hypothetical protein
MLPFKSFPIHRSPVIASLDAMQSEKLTVMQIKPEKILN